MQKPHIPNQKPKVKASSKKPHILKQKQKSPSSSFRWSFIPSGIKGGVVVLGEGHDIVTGESCVLLL
jgi:hypothetical protein